MRLNYETHKVHGNNDYEQMYLKSELYHISSLYEHPQIKNDFINLKANIVDLNPAMITKCIQGTEQDFIMLMNKAKEFISLNCGCGEAAQTILMDLFQECVFGYYVLEGILLLVSAAIHAVFVCANMQMADLTVHTLMEPAWGRFLLCFVSAMLLLGIIILLGIYFPARKAMRIEPADALHNE